MASMTAVMTRRRDRRHSAASAAVSQVLRDASSKGVDITLVGSLARGDFRSHSDVDLLVRGPMDRKRRALAEQLVADGMRASEIPYDLVFEADLTHDRLQEFLDGIV